MRFVVELIKLIIVIMLPAASMILWQKVEIELDDEGSQRSNQYVEFISFVTLSMIFTILTTLWSTMKVRERQQSRRRN